MSDFLPKTEKRNLRYDFTAIETHDFSLSLAGKTKELQALKEEKKTVVSQYSTREKEIQGALNRLSNQVADGWEFRELTMDITYHQPETGKKTLTNTDTGKCIVEKMSDYEWNLFNQPQDDEPVYDPTADPDSDQYDSVIHGPKSAKKRGNKKSNKVKPDVANAKKVTNSDGENGKSKRPRKKLADLAAEVKASAGIVDGDINPEQETQQAF